MPLTGVSGAVSAHSSAKSWDNNRWIQAAGFAAFATLLLYRLVFHHFWRDEAQAWLIAKAAHGPLDLLVVSNEGHPPLWYLILEFIQVFSQNIEAMKVATGVFSLSVLALLWFFSSLNTFDKILISASYYISWQYGVFSRNYMPGVFLLMLFAVFWPYWRRHAILGASVLGLACLVHAFFIPVAGVMALMFIYDWWRERPEKIALLFATVVGLFIVAATLSLYLASPPIEVKEAASSSETTQLLAMIGYPFTVDVVGQPYQTIAGLLFFLAFLPLVSVVLLAAVAGLFLSAFQILIYGGYSWHVGAIYTLLACLYVVYHQRIYRIIPRILLGASAIGGVVVWMTTTLPYGSGQEAARLIRQAGLENARWVAFPDLGGSVPFAVLRRPYWSLECQCEITYVRWGEQRTARPTARQFEDRLTEYVLSGNGEPTYLLLSLEAAPAVGRVMPPQLNIENLGSTGPAVQPMDTFELLRLTLK